MSKARRKVIRDPGRASHVAASPVPPRSLASVKLPHDRVAVLEVSPTQVDVRSAQSVPHCGAAGSYAFCLLNERLPKDRVGSMAVIPGTNKADEGRPVHAKAACVHEIGKGKRETPFLQAVRAALRVVEHASRPKPEAFAVVLQQGLSVRVDNLAKRIAPVSARSDHRRQAGCNVIRLESVIGVEKENQILINRENPSSNSTVSEHARCPRAARQNEQVHAVSEASCLDASLDGG